MLGPFQLILEKQTIGPDAKNAPEMAPVPVKLPAAATKENSGEAKTEELQETSTLTTSQSDSAGTIAYTYQDEDPFIPRIIFIGVCVLAAFPVLLLLMLASKLVLRR